MSTRSRYIAASIAATVISAAVLCPAAPKPQSGQFYKTKMYDGTITVADIMKDSGPAKMVSTAFQGLVNQDTAQCYLFMAPHHVKQLEDTERPYKVLSHPDGENPGLRSLFKAYSGRVKNIYIWSPEEDWSWNKSAGIYRDLYSRM